MAEHEGVWGIDIGQAGLKALRLRYAEAAGQAIAVAFDYVPFPKILSQPDAVPEELIPEALEKFLSRNDVQGDSVAISVPGQAALTRFINLPPVEQSKVAEIVKYEAKQQIPFALEEVIWDYQTLSGGADPDSGFMLDAEVGLFAMKREQVMHQLKPFTDAKVEVDIIQVAPLALYNFLLYDHFGFRKEEESQGREEFTIALDMGADNTTLLVSNGEKIWIRSVPIGGNHFTRALTKEMKLTFAKAEHLKCNATKSPDPRAVFQALRPVFNDYVAEIQRSIGYFSSVNPSARVSRILGLGNGFKLAGLQKFLQQNLQYKVERVESFGALVGDAVLNAPLFQENILSFAVPYGLALQALDATRIHTTLLPPEIATARVIRRKKPWAVAAVAALMLGLTISAFGYSWKLSSVTDPAFDEAIAEADKVKSEASRLSSEYSTKKTENESIRENALKLVENADKRHIWPEVYKAIMECLPRDEGEKLDEDDITKQHRIKIFSITTKRVADPGEWFQKLKDKRSMTPGDRSAAPTGESYIFTLEGLHYHKDKDGEGEQYLDDFYLKTLQKWSIERDGKEIPVRALGISHPIIVSAPPPELVKFDPEGRIMPGINSGFGFGGTGTEGFGGTGYMGAAADSASYMSGTGAETGYMAPDGLTEGNPLGRIPGVPNAPGQRKLTSEEVEKLRNENQQKESKIVEIPRTRFTVQFVWQPVYGEKRQAMMALHDFLEKTPDGDFSAAQQHIRENKQLELTQEWFDEYKAKTTAKPAGEQADAAGG